MHVSLRYCYTIRKFIYKTLTGTYEGCYTMYFRCVVIEFKHLRMANIKLDNGDGFP